MKIKFLFLSFLSFWLFGCSSQKEQEILFEVRYFNEAWGYVHEGFYILKDGRVIVFEHGAESWLDDHSPPYSEKELLSSYGRLSSQVDTMRLTELSDYLQLVEPVKEGDTSQPYMAFDAGTITYTAYLYDDRKYEPVELCQGGNSPRINSLEEAELIVGWLEKIANENELPSCLLPFLIPDS
jgi:hypothetical protein